MIVQGGIYYLIFLASVVLHEFAHAKSAIFLGDDGEDVRKRATLNPVPHMDVLGTLFIPIALFVSGSSVLFGWAKPVRVNPGKIRGGLKGMAVVAAAGPAMNLALALALVILLKLSVMLLHINLAYYEYFLFGIFINTILFLFNIMPIPPLDGSSLAAAVIKDERKRNAYMKYGPYLMILLMLAIFFGAFDSAVTFLFESIRTIL